MGGGKLIACFTCEKDIREKSIVETGVRYSGCRVEAGAGVVVENGADVIFSATEHVRLKPGFIAQRGSRVLVTME